MNDLASALAGGLLFAVGALIVVLLVATIIFRAATKWVAKQDTSFGMSIAIVLLGFIASIIAGFPSTLLFAIIGAPEIFVSILSFLISFSATSAIYMLMLKVSFWRASLIQLVMLLILLVLIFIVALLFGGLAAAI